MGLHIGGLVIDKNFQLDISGLETVLGNKLVLEQEITFKQASANDKETDTVDILFSELGTIIFMDVERASTMFKIPKQRAVSYVIDESSMTFNLCYTKNGFVVRRILEVEGEIVENRGDKLDFEESEEDKIELIYHTIEELVDEYLWDIDKQSRCYRYTLESNKEQVVEESNFMQSIKTIEFEDLEQLTQKDNSIEIINSREEITKVKKTKKSILKKVIKGLGLEKHQKSKYEK